MSKGEDTTTERRPRLNLLRGFRRIGWVLAAGTFVVSAAVIYPESFDFSGYDLELIEREYAGSWEVQVDWLSESDESVLLLGGNSGLVDFRPLMSLSTGEIVGILEAERSRNPANNGRFFFADLPDGHLQWVRRTLEDLSLDPGEADRIVKGITGERLPDEQFASLLAELSLTDADRSLVIRAWELTPFIVESRVDTLRSEGKLPHAWEVETEALNIPTFLGRSAAALAVIVLIIQGSISVIAWIASGFRQ